MVTHVVEEEGLMEGSGGGDIEAKCACCMSSDRNTADVPIALLYNVQKAAVMPIAMCTISGTHIRELKRG